MTKLKPQELKALQSKTINADTLIIKDFNFLLEYIQNHQVEATKSGHHFARKHLSDINEQLSHPIDIISKAPNQKSYPNIAGLYLLLASTGIVWFSEEKRKKFFTINEKLLKNWLLLNPTEQYFALLEIWLYQTDPEMINEYRENILRLCKMILTANDGKRDQSYWGSEYLIALMEEFELVEIKQAKAKKANSWNIERITSTKFVKALFKRLDTHHTEIITSEKLGILQKKFQPYFAPLKQSLVYPESTFTSGVFLFKIQLPQATVWLEMDVGMDFEYFADAILQAFDFDNDHLYQFEYKDMSNRVQKINHYRLDVDRDERYCGDVKLGDTDIAPKSTMLFLFDFGDSWEFHITLEEIDEKRELSQPVIVKCEGTPPKQYLDDEDDESLFMGLF